MASGMAQPAPPVTGAQNGPCVLRDPPLTQRRTFRTSAGLTASHHDGSWHSLALVVPGAIR
jgi:hypothetical protein